MATIRLLRATLVAFVVLFSFVACDEPEDTNHNPNPATDAGNVDTGSDVGTDTSSGPDVTATPDSTTSPVFPEWYTYELCESMCADHLADTGNAMSCVPPEEFDRHLSGDDDPLKADDAATPSIFMLGSSDPAMPCFNPCEGFERITVVLWSCANGTIDDVEFIFEAWDATCYVNKTRNDATFGFDYDFDTEELTLLNTHSWEVETYCYPQ